MPDLFTRLRFRHALLLAVAAALSAAVFVCLQEPEFEVQACILVQSGSEGLKNELALLRSKVLAEQVLTAAGEGRLFPQTCQDEQVKQLQKRLTAELAREANLIQITFRHPQAETATQTVAMLISLFRLQMQKMRNAPTAVLNEELVTAGKEMQIAEKKLIMLGQPDEAALRELAEQRRILTELVETEQKKLQGITEKLALLERQYAGQNDGRDDLLRLKLYEQELLRKYEAHEPLIAEVRQQIMLAREELRKVGSAGLERLADRIVEAKIVHSRQQATAAATGKRLVLLDQALLRLADQENIFRKMQADLEEKRKRHAELMNRLASRPPDISVTVLETTMLTPRRPGVLFKGLAAALGLSGGLICLILLRRKGNR